MYKKILLCLALTICFGMAGCEKDNNARDTSNNQTTNEDMQFVTKEDKIMRAKKYLLCFSPV